MDICFRIALQYQSNSSLLLAFAYCATGSDWSTTTAMPKDYGDRIGLYGVTKAEWNAEVDKIGPSAGITANHITSSHAQCEIAGFSSGLVWKELETLSPMRVTAIDVYLAFITNAAIANKFRRADDAVPISLFLQADELKTIIARLGMILPGQTVSAVSLKCEIIGKLVEKLDTALDFVKAFAESLIIDHVPGPVDEVTTTEQEIHDEDWTVGLDSDNPGPGVPIATLPNIPTPAIQPGDGALLLSEAHLAALWKRSCFPIDGRGLIIFGIRGCLPVDSSGTGFDRSHKVTLENIDYRKMRCAIGQWLPGAGFAVFPGSTVPYAPIVEAGVSKGGGGVNQLGRGRYRNYIPGWHKRREGPRGHWALLQDSDSTFQRTSDDADYDPDDTWNIGRPGDNIHCAFHMGVDANIPDTRYSSAGCQVVAGTVVKGKKSSESGPWKKFITPFLGNSHQAGVEYVLFDGREVQQMILTQCAGKTVILRMGSAGRFVKQLQQRLAECLGITIRTDGNFGAQTFRAVLDFQQRNFGRNADDGIVGPETAEKLGILLPEFKFTDATTGLPEPISASVTCHASDSARPSIVGGAYDGMRISIVRDQTNSILTSELFGAFTRAPGSGDALETYRRYIDYFVSNACNDLLVKFQIAASPKRLAHFFGQAALETGGFKLLRKSLTYTTVAAVRNAWPKRASRVSDDFIRDNLLQNPTALGDWAYGGRMANVKGTSDGFDYRGGGVFQTTGRSAYRAKGKLAQVDLEGNPSLIEDPAISMLAACAEWADFNGNALADADEVRRISRAINLGNRNSRSKANGEDDRVALVSRLLDLLGRE